MNLKIIKNVLTPGSQSVLNISAQFSGTLIRHTELVDLIFEDRDVDTPNKSTYNDNN